MRCWPGVRRRRFSPPAPANPFATNCRRLLLPHLTLVVSPLLALMQDQLAFLQRHGISAGSIDSAQSRDDANDVMARAKSGELKILMISVERLKNERFRQFLAASTDLAAGGGRGALHFRMGA